MSARMTVWGGPWWCFWTGLLTKLLLLGRDSAVDLSIKLHPHIWRPLAGLQTASLAHSSLFFFCGMPFFLVQTLEILFLL
jgi:hypothetical protein